MRVGAPLLLTVLLSCNTTPEPTPEIWGGRFLEYAVTDTAVHLRAACMTVRFGPLRLDANQRFALDGVMTSSTWGGRSGVRQVGRISHDSVFLTLAFYSGSGWGAAGPPDTVLIGVPGDFSPGASCIQ